MKTLVKLNGLTCDACVKIGKMKISKISGVKEITIDKQTGRTEIEADREITLPEIKLALQGTEYRVSRL